MNCSEYKLNEQDFECFVRRSWRILSLIEPDVDFDTSRKEVEVVQDEDLVWIATVTPFQSDGVRREDLNFRIRLTFDGYYRPDTVDIHMELTDELLVTLVQEDSKPPVIH